MLDTHALTRQLEVFDRRYKALTLNAKGKAFFQKLRGT